MGPIENSSTFTLPSSQVKFDFGQTPEIQVSEQFSLVKTILKSRFGSLTIFNLSFFFKPAVIDLSWLSFVFYNLFFTIFYYLGVYAALNLSSYGIEFLLSFNENEVILRSQNYYQFIIRLTFLFAITFQLPLITLFLLNKNLLKIHFLTNNRPELFIFILILSAIVTPTGDPVTLFAFTIPLYLLIEIVIFIHKKISK